MDEPRRRKKKKKNQSKPMEQKAPQRPHFNAPEIIVPQIEEPKPVCSICGQPIDLIIEAISEPDGSFSHFDCVLKKISENEHVVPPQKVSYIGRGVFAVVSPNETGGWDIINKITYESNETWSSMKHFVEDQKK